MSNLTIQNGVARDAGNSGMVPGVEPSFGGGILNLGTTVLDGVDVRNCIAQGGNGKDGTIGDNNSTGGPGFSALGGGIFNSGTLTLDQCIVRNNTAQGGKGGDGALGVVDGTGGDGGSGNGGGIWSSGSLTVFQSTIAGNNAYGGFGGDGANDEVNDGYQGGSAGDAFGGGLSVGDNAAQTLIIESTIASNSVAGGAGGQGGFGGQGGNPLTNMGDSGGGGGNGGVAKGGAIFASSPLSLYNSTIAANQAFGSGGGRGGAGGGGTPNGVPGSDGYTGPAFAGGIWAPADDPGGPGLVTSVSTIIAQNTSAPDRLAGEPDDGEIGFAGASNTLLEDGSGATGISSGSAGNLVGLDPKLGPLQSNGGPTPTMALLPGSPALDAGSNPLTLTTDQRGFGPRVVGPAADIGAYEFGATAPAPPPPPPPASGPIAVKVKNVKGRREIFVYEAGTTHLRFAFYPFGKSYRGTFQVSTAVISGVQDVVVRRPAGHRRFSTTTFSGLNGTPLPG